MMLLLCDSWPQASKGRLSLMRALLKHGATPDVKDSTGSTPMHRWAGGMPTLCAMYTAACLMGAFGSGSVASANPFGLPLKPVTHQRTAARMWRPHVHLS